ncbi:putative bifunctional diguanylate cyclase/phosphodiesterase [Ningiella sp. W23]|uniref:putative bifunctional diguanylate cyclase/phosphodiesterase n=1 Tax=Ningiella sp. W23 TaxID=3023715 RepID=UPI0037581BE2
MKLNKKLSFTLAVRSLVILISLGLVMAFLQTLFDFRERQAEVKQTIDSIVTSARGSASNAVYLLDNPMAQQVIDGLSYFDFFHYVSIIDDRGNIMADFSRQEVDGNVAVNTSYNPLLSLVAENFTKSSVLLTGQTLADGRPQIYGEMVLIIDNHIALSGVYDRASRAFAIAVAGYILLTLVLSILYHFSLAAPLVRLSKRFQQVNTASIASQQISHVVGHEKNEFSLIVNAANDMLSRISSGQILLTERSQRFRLILDTAPSLIYSLDNNLDFVFANKSTASFYGYSIYELKGRCAEDVISPIDPDLLDIMKDFISSSRRQVSNIVPMRNAGGAECFMELTMVKFKTPDGHSILVTSSDVTKRVKAEEKIESLAYYDTLTSLPNRNKVYEVLNKQRSDDHGMYGIAAIADLDQFKRINDTLSHSVGDQLIVKLARRLQKEFSFSDLIARLGADEFLCIEEDVSENLSVATEGAEVLGERLRACINKEIEIGLHSYALTASIGVIVFKKGQASADEILQFADTAMYESKRTGRNKVTMFKTEMAAQAAELLKLERDIMKAMFRDEFYFVLQPIVDTDTHRLNGAEALMRWKKDGKVVSPAEFIPFLEESALIVDVGERILNSVCRYIVELEDRELLTEDFKIAVNISAKQLAKPDFIEAVSRVLLKHKVSGKRLEFEITESVALNNMADTIKKIVSLKKMGISFSLDDFGTGYSSLSHLKDLPVDKLKIDRSFINDITVDKQDENLVRSIIQLSRNLGLVTVAEGVETQEQVEWLMLNGDLLLQGFYFSKPLDIEDFEKQYLLSPADASENPKHSA